MTGLCITRLLGTRFHSSNVLNRNITVHHVYAEAICKTRMLYCIEWTQYSIRLKRSAIRNRCFPGPTRVVDANNISIALAVFAGLTRWQTDWQTDRPRYSVGNHRQRAQWRSQILILSIATTSIYWSSRLDRSDQLKQSAAIFSARLDRLQCMWRHTTIQPPRAFPTSVPYRWHNWLLIHWRTSV